MGNGAVNEKILSKKWEDKEFLKEVPFVGSR